MTRAIPTARRLPGVEPGDPEWLKLITGSKVAAILGLSPWESRFSLWHAMAGTIDREPPTVEQTRGHYLEPVIGQWWADQHTDHKLTRCKSTFAHRHRKWQAASPDGLIVGPDGRATFEAKTAASSDEEWGRPGTDEIPPYYRCQVVWTMDTLGLRRCHLAVLTSYLEFRSYVVEFDEAEAEFMRAAAVEFLRSLETGTPPDIDDSAATYSTLRRLHPDILDVDVTVDEQLADRFRAAQIAYEAAEREKRFATALVAAEIGDGHYAYAPDRSKLAVRVPGRGDSPPYVKACPQRKSKTKDEVAA